MSTSSNPVFRIRSYVPRGRRTDAQERAYEVMWPQYGLAIDQGMIDADKIFGRVAPLFLEIGFGSGQSLLAVAKVQPEHNFIGVETHQPGIGALLMGMQEDDINNLRVFYGDVIDVLEKCIPDAALAGVHIFFPDPWPKRRHHQRRLIQAEFIRLLIAKLQQGGVLHLATDWDHYAAHMMRVLSSEADISNLAGLGRFANRSSQRPIVTKFEGRALREGRSIWEMQFQKK